LKPAYTFKFKGDMAARLAGADIDAAMADKPKKKKKKKVPPSFTFKSSEACASHRELPSPSRLRDRQ
jgi:hypothetical protein